LSENWGLPLVDLDGLDLTIERTQSLLEALFAEIHTHFPILIITRTEMRDLPEDAHPAILLQQPYPQSEYPYTHSSASSCARERQEQMHHAVLGI
jgi:hypothetical protein